MVTAVSYYKLIELLSSVMRIYKLITLPSQKLPSKSSSRHLSLANVYQMLWCMYHLLVIMYISNWGDYKHQGSKDRGVGRNCVALSFYDRTATCVNILSSNGTAV